MPPVIGEGESVDLLKLYLKVKERGGFEKVSETGQWDCVARECGFDSVVGSSLKLVYVQYLGLLSRYLEKVILKEKDLNNRGIEEQSSSGLLCRLLMDVESDLKGRFSGISHKKEKDVELLDVIKTELGFGMDGKLHGLNDHGGFVKLTGGTDILEKKGFVQEAEKGRDEDISKGEGGTDVGDLHFVIDIGQVKRDDDAVTAVDSIGGTEDGFGRKRKPENSCRMLDWIHNVAMDPCNPAIGSMPDSSKWKYYASDLVWKQVLLAREAMLSKRKNESSDHQATLQKKQKMHPTMYDDQCEKPRFSKRILEAKAPSRKTKARTYVETSSSGTLSDDDLAGSQSDSSWEADPKFVGGSRRREKRVPIGSSFQADIPEWTGKASSENSDSKWLGTRLWPLDKAEQTRNLIERERIGKGRQDSCGCQFPVSLECIRFHISEKRARLKLELGLAFYSSRIDQMGEEFASSWTKEDEKKFHNIVETNPSYLGKFFWQEIVKSFPNKSSKTLVSYYYNVYLLRRRGQQNRIAPHDINSDDDESGPRYNTAISPGSIFCSPKKPA
ncbi:OLC1v1039272C2 [Oldenlandia corymbosa var. corymbosa]|nr:OLC1v1039272C2 [Oldenlandia corymbosa var. corymbosa]